MIRFMQRGAALAGSGVVRFYRSPSDIAEVPPGTFSCALTLYGSELEDTAKLCANWTILAQKGERMQAKPDVIDATGKFVYPGMIDANTASVSGNRRRANDVDAK
jgi:imidazolonepropionase-like amidohydrolase